LNSPFLYICIASPSAADSGHVAILYPSSAFYKNTFAVMPLLSDIFNYFLSSLQKKKNNCTFRMKK